MYCTRLSYGVRSFLYNGKTLLENGQLEGSLACLLMQI